MELSYKKNEVVRLVDEEIEILLLAKKVKRLEIAFAPNLKKIISLSPELIIGPEVRRADTPALNYCKSIREIITLGDVKFNTTLFIDGKYRECAWTTAGKDGIYEASAPALTTIGHKPMHEFPCYYYDLSVPIEETKLRYINPEVRSYPIELITSIIESALDDPNSVTSLDKEPQLIKKN